MNQTVPTNTPDKKEPGKLELIKSGLERMRPQLQATLPPHIKPEQFQSVVITAVTNNPDLAFAERRSFFVACSKAAQDGLLPDGREGALVTFKDKNNREIAQWMPMAYGLTKLIRQSGLITSLGARIVYAKEIADRRFEYVIREGREELRHEPMLFGERGEKVLAYAYARWKSGEVEYLPMHRDDILKRKKASRAKSQFSPWAQWEDEMWLKTVLRAIAKRLPMSPSVRQTIESDDDSNSEFERLKSEATQSITVASELMGAPAIEDMTETEPEPAEHVDEDTGEITEERRPDRNNNVETST